MANNYSVFNDEETKTQDCPILLDSVSLKDTDHPKKTILLKTGNKNYCFDTLALWNWITSGNRTHPMTNLELNSHDIERVTFYKEALDKFPETTRAGRQRIIPEMLEEFFRSGNFVEGTWNTPETLSYIDYFADIEDFKPYMVVRDKYALSQGDGKSFRDNANRIMALFADSKYWMLRQTSIADVKNEHEHYAISTNRRHYAIRHSFGQGYWMVSGSNDNVPTFIGPSFTKCLKKINVSLYDLVHGSFDAKKVQLTLLDAHWYDD